MGSSCTVGCALLQLGRDLGFLGEIPLVVKMLGES